eukprot:CAMPEP_0194033558 /NCGR_PEP_ID=MMETSP0009_2-20130614/6207_1 /TAXON_ID=210454 /ORGANISM="Grammatophora oceanica, Strain CCMP 410" /LENGTH=653 /DNA_ID=CAMNT_0038674273 /DNA_START=171 /DNA_END=2132 /DNA_ORIENTATION=-
MKFSTATVLIVLAATQDAAVQGFFGGRTTNNKIVLPTTSTTSTQLQAEITMPALSSTMKEGRVVRWLKEEGDSIEAGDAIMVVESDKADMDVEAFEDGVLAKILTSEGESSPVGSVVALVADSSDDIDSVISGFTTNGSSGSEEAAAPAAEAAAATSSADAPPDVSFSQIDMPALSSTMKEGKVVSWLKEEGDAISAGDAIMVVESDKADMDVEAFEDGYLAAILTEEGDSGLVGAPVALIAENEDDIPTLKAYASTLSGQPVVAAAAPAAAATPAAKVAPKQTAASVAAYTGDRIVASPLAKKKALELNIDLGSVVGSGPGGRITASDVENAVSGTGAPKTTTSSGSAAATPKKPSWTPGPGVIAATPTARQLAKKAKVDLSQIPGTGSFGRVTAEDVQRYTGQLPATKKPKKKTSSGEEVLDLPDGFVPFTTMQRAVSKNMEATMTTPIFRVSREIEMDKFDTTYQKLKPKGVTVSALLAKAVALAIEKYPIINSSYSTQDGGGIVYNKDINIAMAVAVDGGLITPVLKYANERSAIELGENWKELVGKAKSGTLVPDEYTTGTFAISNMGMFGVSQFDAILPAGLGGILAIGATQEHMVSDPQAVLGMRKVKKMTVTLTCDHRQIYGADAALYLKELAAIMSDKVDLLLK